VLGNLSVKVNDGPAKSGDLHQVGIRDIKVGKIFPQLEINDCQPAFLPI
jgi:hypothetical protein